VLASRAVSTSRGVLPGASPVRLATAEDVGVDGYLDLAEHHVENDAGGLAPDPWQRLERGAVGRQLTAVPFEQLPAESNEVAGLGVVQAYAS